MQNLQQNHQNFFFIKDSRQRQAKSLKQLPKQQGSDHIMLTIFISKKIIQEGHWP